MVTRSDFNKYILPVYNPAKFIPKKAKDILELNNYVRLKVLKNVYKSLNV